MTRLRLWLVVLPLVTAGTEGAASIVDLFAPKRYETVELFSRSNASHALLPPAAAVGSALLVCAVGAWAVRAEGPRRLPRWLFAALPPLAFALQEHVEYVVGHGHVPWTLALTPTFLAGLLLQAPFALAAYLVARLLLKVAAVIAQRGRTVRARRRPAVPGRPRREAPLRARLADGRSRTRGPPRPLTT